MTEFHVPPSGEAHVDELRVVVAAYVLGTAPSRETMLRDSRASKMAAPK